MRFEDPVTLVRIRWEGRQGRLEIVYVNGRWFAYLPIEVGREPPKSNKKGYVRPNYKDKKGRIVNPKRNLPYIMAFL